jgi:hypothetical protein
MKWIRCFILSAGAILLAAALTRFLIGFGNAQVLALPEPLLGIPLRYAVLLVGALELAVAVICLFGKKMGIQIGGLAWLTANYFVFRAALLWLNCHPQATCIGSLSDPLQTTRGMIGLVLPYLPIYLVIGTGGSGIWLWLKRRATLPEGVSKMSCPACGVHIRFNNQNLGQTISCPQCHGAIKLRNPDESLKMSCFFCQGHIAFPSHALGQKMPCPHCSKDITLIEPK